MEKIPVATLPSAWLFWLLIAGTLALGLLRRTYAQQFKNLLRSPFRTGIVERREIRFDLFNVTLEVWAIIAVAIGVLFIQKSEIVFTDWAIVARYALTIAIFLTLQGTIYQLAGYVFIDQDAYSAAWQEKAQFLRWSAIWMTPIIWWLSFAGEPRELVRWVGAGILIVLYTWSLARLSNVIIRQSHLRLYHNVLYLCALEIAPVVLLLQII